MVVRCPVCKIEREVPQLDAVQWQGGARIRGPVFLQCDECEFPPRALGEPSGLIVTNDQGGVNAERTIALAVRLGLTPPTAEEIKDYERRLGMAQVVPEKT